MNRSHAQYEHRCELYGILSLSQSHGVVSLITWSCIIPLSPSLPVTSLALSIYLSLSHPLSLSLSLPLRLDVNKHPSTILLCLSCVCYHDMLWVLLDRYWRISAYYSCSEWGYALRGTTCQDPSLFCVSAWNDNGFKDSNNSETESASALIEAQYWSVSLFRWDRIQLGTGPAR